MMREFWAARKMLLLLAATTAIGLWSSYGMARLGEPQSKWIWCDLLDACPDEGED